MKEMDQKEEENMVSIPADWLATTTINSTRYGCSFDDFITEVITEVITEE